MKRTARLLATAAVVTASAWTSPLAAGAAVPTRGPYLLSSAIDSTCGSPAGQALGAYTATAPTPNPDGSYDVRITFTATFVTLAGSSLNACHGGTNSGRTIREGVTGSFASTSSFHLTQASFVPGAGCPRDALGSCNPTRYLQSAYGAAVSITQTSLHAVLRSSAPRLLASKMVESCAGAACAAGTLTISGDIASGRTPPPTP